MACDISRGRLEPCKDSVGGIDKIFIANRGDLSDVDYNATDSDVIDTFNSSPTVYEFDVRGASTYTETPTSSRDNGTTFFEQVLELQLKKLTKEDHKTIKLLAWGSPSIIILDNNGNYLVAGLEYGLDITGGSIATGGAMGDMSGYTLTFTGMEKVPANFVNIPDPIVSSVLVDAGCTVTQGS